MYFIYRFKDKNNEIIYVGKSIDLKGRMKQHFERDGHLLEEHYKKVHKVEYVKFKNRIDMDIMELYFINKWSPEFNATGNYNESTELFIEDDYEWIELLNKQQINSSMSKRETKEVRILFHDEILGEKLKSFSQFKNEEQLTNTINLFIERNNPFLNETDIEVIRVLLSHSKENLGVSFISKGDLAEELGRVRRTIIRICDKLEDMGLIRQEKMVGMLRGGQVANAIIFVKGD